MNKHLILPVALVLAAILIGGTTIAINNIPGSHQPIPVEARIITASISPAQVAAAGMTESRTIRWSTENYPKASLVNINLIRKISDSPLAYEFVESIAVDTANDGVEIWDVENATGDDLYIEITCSAMPSDAGCRGSEPIEAF
jgi:hypothetical protein